MLQNWEDETVLSQREAEFQQRVIASTLPHDPELKIASALFPATTETGASVERNAEGDFIVFPSSEEEFAEMIGMFEQVGDLPAP